MNGRALIILLFVLSWPINAFDVTEAWADNFNNGGEGAVVARELAIDKAFQKFAQELSIRDQKKEAAAKKLEASEIRRRFAVKKKEPGFFFTLQHGTILDALKGRKMLKVA